MLFFSFLPLTVVTPHCAGCTPRSSYMASLAPSPKCFKSLEVDVIISVQLSGFGGSITLHLFCKQSGLSSPQIEARG
ncbi:hypothetical protein FB446DRAFT_733687 [Lentinula raphanica]|nr:hypothetical protein FB446DRAFT_733687 [Lentinula raphanica]